MQFFFVFGYNVLHLSRESSADDHRPSSVEGNTNTLQFKRKAMHKGKKQKKIKRPRARHKYIISISKYFVMFLWLQINFNLESNNNYFAFLYKN